MGACFLILQLSKVQSLHGNRLSLFSSFAILRRETESKTEADY